VYPGRSVLYSFETIKIIHHSWFWTFQFHNVKALLVFINSLIRKKKHDISYYFAPFYYRFLLPRVSTSSLSRARDWLVLHLLTVYRLAKLFFKDVHFGNISHFFFIVLLVVVVITDTSPWRYIHTPMRKNNVNTCFQVI
jgi:hypothetical protein